MTAPTTYEIGVNLAGAATLTSLSIPNPESEFIDFAQSVRLASGSLRAMGYPQVVWHYGYLTAAQYDNLRVFCTGASSTVCIATMNNDREFARYNCVMNMPERFGIRATRYIDITILFNLVTAAE